MGTQQGAGPPWIALCSCCGEAGAGEAAILGQPMGNGLSGKAEHGYGLHQVGGRAAAGSWPTHPCAALTVPSLLRQRLLDTQQPWKGVPGKASPGRHPPKGIPVVPDL